MLARQYVPLELEDEDLRTILLNAHINDHFLSLAREVKSLFNIVKKIFLFILSLMLFENYNNSNIFSLILWNQKHLKKYTRLG